MCTGKHGSEQIEVNIIQRKCLSNWIVLVPDNANRRKGFALVVGKSGDPAYPKHEPADAERDGDLH